MRDFINHVYWLGVLLLRKSVWFKHKLLRLWNRSIGGRVFVTLRELLQSVSPEEKNPFGPSVWEVWMFWRMFWSRKLSLYTSCFTHTNWAYFPDLLIFVRSDSSGIKVRNSLQGHILKNMIIKRQKYSIFPTKSF